MPTSRHEVDDGMPKAQSDKYKLVRREISGVYEYQVVTLQKYAQIESQVRKQSKAAEVELALQVEEQIYRDRVAKLKAVRDADVARILSSSKTAAEQAKEIRDAEKEFEKQKVAARKDYSKLEEKLTAIELDNAKKVHETAVMFAENEYKTANIRKKKLIADELANLSKVHLQTLAAEASENKKQIQDLQNQIAVRAAAGKSTTALQKQLNDAQQREADIKNQTVEAEKKRSKAQKDSLDLARKITDAEIAAVKATGKGAQELKKNLEDALSAAEKERDELIFKIATDTKLGIDTTEAEERLKIVTEQIGDSVENGGKGLAAQLEKVNEDAHKQRLQEINSQNKGNLARQKLQDKEADYDSAKVDKEAEHDAAWEFFKSERGQQEARDKALTKALANSIGAALDAIDNNIASFYQYQAHVEARLQGSDTSYRKALKEVSNNIGISGVVSQKDVIAKIKEASDAGVAYNLELRAFLGTVADSIANTFDAFDASLLRIIRLQQADTTAARLGMEASLTKLFNEYFSDTSYLSDVFDSVSETLLDASSQLARDQSVAFEYMVQKWLGSLYSLGFSQETLQTIAQGITYLGTGNVQELTSNDSLNSLMAMAATRVGLDYGAILVDGLDSDTTNKLLKSVVEYLQTIANNTDNNQVVKSAYTDVFGLNMTDLRAIQSLTEGDVQNIYKQSMEYNDMIKETNKQMLLTLTRVPFAQMIDTAFENAMAGASTAIGNNPALYATWKVLNVVEDLTGGIDLPFLNVYGFGVDLNTTVTQLAKLGVGGLGLMGSLLGSLFSGGLFGTFNINQWDWDEYTSRGSATKGITKGSVSDVSESQEMSMNGSASSDDVKQSSMSDGADSADEDAKVVNKNNKPSDIYQKIYEALADEDTSVLKESIAIHKLLEESRVFKTSMDGMSELLDPKHIFYTQTVVYDAMGNPVFGAAGSTTSSAPGSATGAATDVGQVPTVSGAQQTADPLVGLITTTNDLLTAIKASEETIATNSGSTNSGIDSIKTKLDSIITSGSDIATKLTTINDSITGLGGTGSSTTASVDLSPLLTTSEELKTLVSSVVSLLTTTNDILDDITVIDNTVGRGIDLDSIVQALTSIDQHGLNLTTLSSTTNDLLTADRVFKTQSVDEGIDLSSVDTSLTSVQDISTTIVALLLATNELLKTDRVFNTSPNLDLGIISTAIDTSTQRITNALGAPVESNGDATIPALQSLYDLASHSTIEANVAAILEKLSGETALNVTNVIPPVTRDELTTLIGNTRVFSVDTSATNLELLFTSLLNIRTQLNENSTFTQDVLDATDSLISTIINTPQSSTDTSDIVSNQESNNTTETTVQENDVTSSTIDNINNLVKSVEEWEYLVAQQEAAAQAAVSVEPSNINIPTSLNASVTTITPDVRKQIEAMFKEAFIAALVGSMNKNSEEETSLTSILQSVFSSMNVRVTNDFFDETLQKIAFTN